jgi:hypothetical protein
LADRGGLSDLSGDLEKPRTPLPPVAYPGQDILTESGPRLNP